VNTLEIVLILAGLLIGVVVGYDAERWDRNVNAWSLIGAVFSVLGLAAWLVVRHQEAEHRRMTGEELPPRMRRWLRLRRQARSAG
jgi:uncharacterized membrane protein